ncbi:hypothetical protein LTR49_001489 [Elasticomyces elasticus]|nr:hypothetical protein LTR49_001489 [Elasticomyces elasticus]
MQDMPVNLASIDTPRQEELVTLPPLADLRLGCALPSSTSRKRPAAQVAASQWPAVQSGPYGRFSPSMPPSPSTSDMSRSASPAASRQPADAKKTLKERESRKEQRDVNCDMEDSFHLYTGYTPVKVQTAGNGFTSGLENDKLMNQIQQGALLNLLLQQSLDEAHLKDLALDSRFKLEDGPNVKALRAEWLAWAEAAVRDNSVLTGTWFDDGTSSHKTRCDHVGKSKACDRHLNQPDYRRCRKAQRKRMIEHNLSRRVSRHNQDRAAKIQRRRESRLS